MSVKEIKASPDTNFVAEVSSVFHLLCALSFAYKKSKGEYINGIIFVRSHYVMNDPIEERIIEFNNLRIELISFKTDYKNINLICESGSERAISENSKNLLYVLSVKVPNYSLYKKWKSFTDKKIEVVLIDEGTGTYYNSSGFMYPIINFFKKKLIELQGSKVEEYFILKRKNNKLISNDEIAPDFVELLSDEADYLFNIDQKYKNDNSSSKYAIFISGLFVEMGLISVEEYKKKLYDVETILEKNNIKLLIKPYQSEDLEKYSRLDIELLQWDIPCEVLFPVIKPLFTLGFQSTSMLTGKVLYGIKSIDLSILFNLKSNKDYYRKYEKMFLSFSDFMLRSNTLEEFYELIKTNR